MHIKEKTDGKFTVDWHMYMKRPQKPYSYKQYAALICTFIGGFIVGLWIISINPFLTWDLQSPTDPTVQHIDAILEPHDWNFLLI